MSASFRKFAPKACLSEPMEINIPYIAHFVKSFFDIFRFFWETITKRMIGGETEIHKTEDFPIAIYRKIMYNNP